MKKKRSSVLQKLDSNFKSKLENLFGGRTTKKIEKPQKSQKSKKPKRKLKFKTNILTMPEPPLLPPPMPIQPESIKIESVDEIEVEKINNIDLKINKNNENNNENNKKNNKKNNENNNEKKQMGMDNNVYQKVIEKLITLNSHLIDREIEKMKQYTKNWWDIEHKSFLLGVFTSLLSFLISYLV